MYRSTTWRQIAREWLAATLIFSLVILTPGCQFQLSGDGLGLDLGDVDTSIDPTRLNGLLLDDGSDDGAILAARGTLGSFFVYGTRDAAGGIERVDQILVIDSDGAESFLAFESGRPVHAEGPDGSYVHVVYDSVSSLQLVAQVQIYSVASDEVTRYTVEIDLAETAQAIADRVREVTGVELATTDVTAGVTLEKSGSDQTRVTIFSPLFSAIVLPFVALMNAMTVILGQILTALSAIVTAVVYSVLIVALSPFILVAELLSQSIVNIRVIPLIDVFGALPPPNVITLAFED